MIELVFGLNKFELVEESTKEKNAPFLPLFIKGKSVNAGYIRSKNFYIPDDELDSVVNSLKTGVDGSGAYILKDHGFKSPGSSKSVDLLVGKIVDATKDKRNVFYKGRIEDADIAHKMRKGLVSASSISLNVKQGFCSICGKEYGDPECQHLLGKEYSEGFHESFKQYLPDFENKPIATIIGKGIEAMEQSIVLFPALPGASAIPMFNFSKDTEDFINGVEGIKKIPIELEGEDLFEKDAKIILELDKIIESTKSTSFDINEIKAYLATIGFVVIKTEDLKSIKDSLKSLEVEDWCKTHSLEYDPRMDSLSNEELELFAETTSKLRKSNQIGHPAGDDNSNYLSEEENKKENIRTMIFNSPKRTPQEVAEIRRKKDIEKQIREFNR